MKTDAQRLVRFGRFLARLWPLWMIWAIIWFVPASRSLAHRHIFGSIYEAGGLPSLRSIWRETSGQWDEEIDNPLPAAKTHPRDLDLALWENVWNSQSFYVRGRKNQNSPELDGIIKKFPDQIIAYAPVLQDELQIYRWRTEDYGNASPNKQLRDLARRAHRLEPDNAAWLVAQALSASRAGDFAGTLKLLQNAAKCPVYDDKTLEIARRILNAHARYGALQNYEKREIVSKIRAGNGNWETIAFWGNHAAFLRKTGETAEALQWSAALSKIGALMQRDPNSSATRADADQWQQQAWSLGLPRKRGDKTPVSERFARYAISQSRADLAAAARAQAKQSSALSQLLSNTINSSGSDNWETNDWLRANGLSGYLSLVETGGFCLITASCYLFVWWLTVNLFGWRAGGVAASRVARVGLSASVVVSLLIAATASAWFFTFDNSRASGAPNPHAEALENGFGSLGVFSFVSAPFVLALVVAIVTLWRHRERFDLPPRVDTELALPLWARALLRWFLPLGVILSVTFLVVGWVLWIVASWNRWGNADLLAWLPPDRNGKTGSLFFDLQNDPTLFVYGIFMCCVCLLIWFCKWRWATAKELRPLTHSALRWWKETLGIAIVGLSWAYFFVALIGWPIQQKADARLNRVLRDGELSVLRELQSHDSNLSAM